MKKRNKIIITVISSMAAVILVFCGVFMYQFSSATKSMAPIDTKNVTGEVYAVKDGFVNMYLIKGADGYVAVDAGNDKKIIEPELKKLGIDPDRVIAVFLTHSDGDHTASIQLFKNARVFLSEKEENMVNGRTKRFLIFGNKIPGSYALLRDNSMTAISGIQVRGISTPGHTPGSMCYIVNDTYLFTGDTISLSSGKADLFVKLFNMDEKTQVDSIKKLASLAGIKFIFTAHHGSGNDHGKAFMDHTGIKLPVHMAP